MKAVWLIAFTAISLFTPVVAGNSSPVSITALKDVETLTDSQFAADPWDMLGYTRGTYLPGYGAVFTFEMSLINVAPISIFHTTVTPQEIRTVHERKLKQLGVLKEVMRDLLVKSASALNGLPPAEQIVFEAHLASQNFEDHEGLPWRLAMSASRQKLLDAVARHATSKDLATLVEERKE